MPIYQFANDDHTKHALIQMIQLDAWGCAMVVQCQKIQNVEQACEDARKA
jgi:hypothetical protein